MATLILTARGDMKHKKINATGRFLQEHALGLMAGLTDVINDISGTRVPTQERKRCINAMEEMVRTGKHYIRIARPQVWLRSTMT
jgi:serine/threonine-protein kinase ATR